MSEVCSTSGNFDVFNTQDEIYLDGLRSLELGLNLAHLN